VKQGFLPGDEAKASIVAAMDQVRLACGATGVLLASTSDDLTATVEISRSSLSALRSGDSLVIRRLPRVQRSILGGSSNSKTGYQADIVHLEKPPYVEFSTQLFTMGPIKSIFIRSLEVDKEGFFVCLYANKAMNLPQDALVMTVEMLTLHCENALRLRNTLQKVTQKLDFVENKASSDELTGLLNRYGFTLAIQREQRRRERYPMPVSIFVFDLDGLKTINDTYGHQAGDQYIQRFATLLGQTCRAIDFTARLGGDEFAVLAPHTDSTSAQQMASRLRRVFTESQVPVSFGFASDDAGSTSIDDLIVVADAQMYANKQSRRLLQRREVG
jgi:diguanylate cyclase (GGDEF)-like protein